MFDFMQHFHLGPWMQSIGYVGIALVVFLEMGVFFAFFLPGDTLVLTAGILAARGIFELKYLFPIFIISSVLGYFFGYWFGSYLGGWLWRRPESFWCKKRYLEQAQAFYAEHGGKALVLGRFVPVVRTFVPIIAGMGKMNRWRYSLYTVIGALLWGVGITLVGYYLTGFIPNLDRLFLPIILIVFVLSILPALLHHWIARRRNSKPPSVGTKKS